MSDVPFYRTIMGHRFIEATVPALVTELQRLNTNLARLVAVLEKAQPTEKTPEEPR